MIALWHKFQSHQDFSPSGELHMSHFLTPREIVNRQLIAYNAHDIDDYCALFAEDATVSMLATGETICDGLGGIRDFYAKRFTDNPRLHCMVHQHMDGADFAIDRETVSGLPSGDLHIIAIYEVREGLIHSLKFIRRN
jgi:hypothetical protein